MSIKITGLIFENPGQPDDKKFTIYDFEILESEKGFHRTFIIRESEFNEGSPIGDNLILNAASAMVDRSKKLDGVQVLESNQGLQAHQVTIYAERSDGRFTKCSFREYHPTQDPEPVIDFTKEGGAKIPVPKEFVENEIAQTESWKHREPEAKWQEQSLKPPPRETEIVSNLSLKLDSNLAKESNREWERSQAREREQEPER